VGEHGFPHATEPEARGGAVLTHADWLARVPELLQACCEQWELRVGEPYPAGAAGHAVRAEFSDGSRAVLKLVYPHRESEHEADALELWDGDGAVRLLARDDERWAMLIERCEPGTYLSERGQDEALDVLIGLLPRLWKPAGRPFRPLAEEAAWWQESLPRSWEEADRPYERRLLKAAVEALQGLAPTQGQQVLVHQDLHAENVLAARREPWLAIDPKPLVGEREFALASIVRSFELGDTRRDVLHRLDRVSAELALDRERARGWAIGQTLAWADGDYMSHHVQTVRWLVEAA
jgi:streptomycin 6-kinase